jgi:electron transport complex protein RnfB
MPQQERKYTRRDVLRGGTRGAGMLSLGAAAGYLLTRAGGDDSVWQINPYKCVACENCATHCVLETSAVKCVHNFQMCGYCKLCFGYYDTNLPQPVGAGTEKQICPTGAIVRRHVEADAYQYTIDEELCIGCGECVKSCADNANGSLFLQVRHDRCLNCNECSIAVACPVDAFERVPASRPYITKTFEGQQS